MGSNLRLSLEQPRAKADRQLNARLRASIGWLLTGVVALACLLAPPLMQAGVHSPVRTAAVVVLFTLAPGRALLPLFSRRRFAHELGLVLAISLACCGLGAQLMLWLGAWSPSAATWALAMACLLLIAASFAGPALAQRRSRSADTESDGLAGEQS